MSIIAYGDGKVWPLCVVECDADTLQTVLAGLRNERQRHEIDRQTDIDKVEQDVLIAQATADQSRNNELYPRSGIGRVKRSGFACINQVRGCLNRMRALDSIAPVNHRIVRSDDSRSRLVRQLPTLYFRASRGAGHATPDRTGLDLFLKPYLPCPTC